MKTCIHLFTSRRFVALRLRLTGLAILSPQMTAPTQYYLLEFTWTRTRPSSPGTDPVRDWDFLFFSPYSLKKQKNKHIPSPSLKRWTNVWFDAMWKHLPREAWSRGLPVFYRFCIISSISNCSQRRLRIEATCTGDVKGRRELSHSRGVNQPTPFATYSWYISQKLVNLLKIA